MLNIEHLLNIQTVWDIPICRLLSITLPGIIMNRLFNMVEEKIEVKLNINFKYGDSVLS